MSSDRFRLKLASYNLHNLGRQDHPGGYDAKLRFLADVLRRLAPDVAVVEEVREEECFFELADALGWPTRLLGDEPEETRKIRVGILAQMPAQARGQWHDFPVALADRSREAATQEFRRPVPWMRFELANHESLMVVGVHLKSRRAEVEALSDEMPIRRRVVLGQALASAGRVREAAGLRCLLDDEIESGTTDHFAVMGDYNDGPDSETVLLVAGAGLAGPAEDGSLVCRTLFPVGRRIPGPEPYSYSGWDRKEFLDHILVSRDLALSLTQAGVESQLLDAQSGYRGSDGTTRCAGSDHAPVWAEFELAGG